MGLTLTLTLTLTCVRGKAAADEVSTGINVEHFVPGTGAGALLGIDGAGPPAERYAFAASLDYARGLLAIRNRFTRDVITNPVRSLVALDLSAEATLVRGLSVGIGLPVALGISGDRLAGLGLGDESRPSAPVMGDLRLRLRYHLGGGPVRFSLRGYSDVALLLVATFPVGGESQFFATSGPTIEPRLVESWTSPEAWFRIVVLAGYRFQPAQHIYDLTLSHQLHVAGGFELHVPRGALARFHLFLELEGFGLFTRSFSYDERVGLRIDALSWLAVDVGVGGVPLGDGPAGDPSFRIFTILRAGR